MIQSRRKENGLDVSDRIILKWKSASALVQASIAEHQDYIMEQVLAVQLSGDVSETGVAEELGDGQITFDVVRADTV
jgi:hypothetical protein